MNERESPSQNQQKHETSEHIEPRIMEQIAEGLRDMFRSAVNPIAVLVQTMETEEFKRAVPDDVANPVKAQLQTLIFEDENDFVTKVIEISMPVLKITERGKKNLYKQEGREMFTEEDVEQAARLAKESDAKKIYVVGNVGAGKTTFARELSRATGYKNIDIDHWFQIFRQEQRKEPESLQELLGYILQKEKPPFIMNHADLLELGLVEDADMIVFLNPKKEELLKSRRLRTEKGTEGGWRMVNADDDNTISEQNAAKLEELGGEIKYTNERSGTTVRVLKAI